jgi:two-component system, sensor histidine kinase and response regulator
MKLQEQNTQASVTSTRQAEAGSIATAKIESDLLGLKEQQQVLEDRCIALQQSLQQSERSLRACFDYSFIGILETDQNWRILRANRASSSITGFEIRELSAHSLLEMVPEVALSKADRHLAVLLEQGIAQSEWHILSQSGQLITITIGSVQTDENRYVHFIDDVTEQRRASQAIDEARLAAEAADRAKSEFLSNVSHEIRTPLNGIIGLSQLALMQDTNHQQEYLKLILSSGRILLEIVNDLLDYAKIEAGKMDYEQAGFSVEDLLDNLAGHFSQNAREKHLEIAFILNRGVPNRVVGDKLRIWQCLNNLLGNAVKFTDSGKVTLEITWDGRSDAFHQLIFNVRDSGIGISPEVLSRLFKPFSQADSSTARRFGGTGLGLVIVQELVRGMGGTLQVVSMPGEGSRFTINLPIQTESPCSISPSFRGYALVISSREATRESAIELLERDGWRSQIFIEPKESVPFTDGSKFQQFDLVVFDTSDAQFSSAFLRQLPQSLPLLAITDTHLESGLASELRQRALTEMAPIPLSPTKVRGALNRLFQIDGALKDNEEMVEIPQEFSGTFLMVAEDNRVNQAVILDLLERAGIKASLASTGREVIDLLSSLPETPDAILMDVQMPEMDGLQATRQLRAEGWTLPIIAMSAGISKAEQALCIEAGMSDFLGKPLEIDELWGALTRWIAPRDIASVTQSGKEDTNTTAKIAFQSLANIKRIFIQDHCKDATSMAGLLSVGKLEEIARMAHSIKGIADNVGGHRLTEIARKIENAAGIGDLESLREYIQALDSEINRYINNA